jgi:hypothetical protein
LGAGLLGLAALVAGAALRADDALPPTRAARLSSVEGHVRVAQGNQLLADPALVNVPLFEGCRVLTSADGRAEIQLDDGSVARLSPNSSLQIKLLRGQAGSGDAEIVLQSGLGYFELTGESAANHVRIRFGDSVVIAAGITVLRINLDGPSGVLAILSGDAHLERGAALALDLHGGESVTLNATDPSQYSLDEAIEPDSWDTWNADRDQALATLAAARTGVANGQAENNNPAWNDLDANGSWYNVAGQGPVWSPDEAVNSDWDPYGNGNWMWTSNFGYVWVSGDSWGYLPFQCGVWNYYSGFGWGWTPGMGRPWWDRGRWSSNIGNAPGGYRPPLRPHPLAAGAAINSGFRSSPHPLVAVNRRPPSGTERLALRDRSSSVTIAGQLVQPLRPVASRPQYNAGQMNRSRPAYAGARTPAGQRPAFASHPATASGARPSGGSRAPASSHAASGGGSTGSQSSSSSRGGSGGGGRR